MGLLDRIEQRHAVSLSSPDAGLLRALGGGSETYSGKRVTPHGSLELVPVFSAVSLLAGAVGSLPLLTYATDENGSRRRAVDHRSYRLLHERPNEFMAADELWELVMVHLLLWGNAYLAKRRDPRTGLLSELHPIDPARVTCAWDTAVNGRRGGPIYHLDGDTERRYTPADVLHVRGLGTNGRVGLSPIQAARQALGNVAAQEEFSGRFWKNNARPGGILRHPGELSDRALKRLRASWNAAQGGLRNAGQTAILEDGMEWQSLSMPLADAQFIEQAKWGRTEIALLFRVPPYMLAADVGSSLTYSTSEMQSLDFVKWSLRRWLKRIEGALYLDPDVFGQPRFYAEFLIDGLLRADAGTRAEVYTKALGRWLTPNEVRERENLGPIPGGDTMPAPVAGDGEEAGS